VGHTFGPPPGDVSVVPFHVKLWGVSCPFSEVVPAPFFSKFSVYVPSGGIVALYLPVIVAVGLLDEPQAVRLAAMAATANRYPHFVTRVTLNAVASSASGSYAVAWASVPE